VAFGGSGVGRLNGLVYFVPFTTPGDVVRVIPVHSKKNYVEAEIVELIKAGPQRVSPKCEYFGRCGGCQWQNLTYEEQLRQKQNIVTHALGRMAKEENIEVKSIVPSPKEWNYRNRAQFRIKNKEVGFYKRSSRDLVDVRECQIIDNNINKELSAIRTKLNSSPVENREKKIEIYLKPQGGVVYSENRAHAEELGFSQVNTEQNLQLQKLLVQEFGAPQTEDKALLELYCGNGNFSFPLMERGWDIYGIDSSRAAISSARETLKREPAMRGFFSCDDAEAGARKLLQKGRVFKRILLDPPRIGISEMLAKHIGQLKPEKLVYISCNPATFARDWARIKSHTPLKLMSVTPFDMFPQTFHVELLAVAALSQE
jgi:23S rRNA (uracil1939-C5)-methyltransferase